jgi:serine/threonine-protein kinase
LPGTIVRGKYRIVRKLGQGGMGVVYLAEHTLLGGQTALKFLATELSRDPKFIKRFRNEARAAFQLRHTNIVEVLDLDQAENGCLFIAMEFVNGPSLRAAIDGAHGGMSVGRALAIARGVASGLAAAHSRGTVHRDIKPENILLSCAPGREEQPKVLDFGIASMLEGATVLNGTRGLTQGLLLTPDYAAPEQWRGVPGTELDGRTDLYALGGILYEMLTGQTPFHAHNTEGWMYQHLQETPRPPSQLKPELADWPGLDALVLRLLAREREQRPASIDELLTELDCVAARSVEPPQPIPSPTPDPEPIPGFVPWLLPDPVAPKSRTTLWAIGAVLAAVALIGFGFLAMQQPKTMTAVPSLTPPGGSSLAPQAVVIDDATPGAAIHYTLDGTPPSSSSTLYTHSLTNLRSGAVVRAMAVASGYAPSSDVTGVYLNGVGTYEQGKASYDQKQYDQARTSFDQACDGGEAQACSYLGYLYAQGLGGARDAPKARAAYQKACDQGDLSSCASLGVLYQEAGNANDASAYFQKACNGGVAEGCELLRGVK